MSIIKITGSGAYEHTQETNHSLEYLKRTLTEHKLKPTLDHPDGSVTEEKLSAEVRDQMNKHESDIQELNEKKADKSELDTKADKTIVYTKSETDTILSTKADKATTYTIAQTDTILSAKADKADVLSLQELATLNNEHVMTHDTDIRNLTEDKANKTDVYFLQQWCDNLNENKADRSELPTKVSQLENDKNYVTPEEIQPIYQDINYLDTQTRNLKTTKADKATTYTATETDDMLSTKADIADLDSINSLINKNFELIATQTVSPDTDGSLPNAIEFTVDDNGEPFELTDFFLLANTQITGSSTVFLIINDIRFWGNATISGLSASNPKYYWNIQYVSFGEDNGGVISAPKQAHVHRAPQGNFYDDYSVYVPPAEIFDKTKTLNNIKKIQPILLKGAVTFVEGSTFELWGVKKK